MIEFGFIYHISNTILFSMICISIYDDGHIFNSTISRLFFSKCSRRVQFQLKFSKIQYHLMHSMIRGVLIQSCSAGAKHFTNYVFCHPQFSGVIQNIENCSAILTPICLCQLLSK